MKIAILGSAPSSRLLAPFADNDWQIWACSPPNYNLPRVDAWFELHHLDRKINHPANAPYIHVLIQHPQVFIAVPDARLPKAKIYPKDQMVAKYGEYFFTSSLAWMMAFAIEMKPEKIGIWGVDMSAQAEYGYQRAGMHYFMQKAKDAGIKLKIPYQSDLNRPVPLYGFKEQYPMFWKHMERRKELTEKIEDARRIIQEQKHIEHTFLGALDGLNYQDNTWMLDTRVPEAPEPVKAPKQRRKRRTKAEMQKARIKANGKDETIGIVASENQEDTLTLPQEERHDPASALAPNGG